jgi:surface protein
MFYYADLFNQDLSKWDTKNVEDMCFMFMFAKSFNHDLSKWNMDGIKRTQCVWGGVKYMFEGTLLQKQTAVVDDFWLQSKPVLERSI